MDVRVFCRLQSTCESREPHQEHWTATYKAWHMRRFRSSSSQWTVFAAGGWRRPHKIPLEMVYQLVWTWGRISPQCWVHCMFLFPRNRTPWSTLWLFRVERYCIVCQISYLILGGKKNTICPNMIIAPSSLCLLNGIMLSRWLLSILFCKNAFQTFLSDFFQQHYKVWFLEDLTVEEFSHRAAKAMSTDLAIRSHRRETRALLQSCWCGPFL